jgi:hypothetical protein
LLLVYRDDRTHLPNPDFDFLFFDFPSCHERIDAFVNGAPRKGVLPHPIPKAGAIDALATGRLPEFIQSSTTAGGWKDLPPLATSLRTYAIGGYTPLPDLGVDPQIKALWGDVLGPCGFTMANMFPGQEDSNDRVVTMNSQTGGLKDHSIGIKFTDHFSVLSNEGTMEMIRVLLDASLDLDLFTKGPSE